MFNQQTLQLLRGEIYLAELNTIDGVSSIQQGTRPVIIISNNMANRFSPVITAIPLTSQSKNNKIPTHVTIEGFGLPKASTALCEQILTIDKKQIKAKVGTLNQSVLRNINIAMLTQLGIDSTQQVAFV